MLQCLLHCASCCISGWVSTLVQLAGHVLPTISTLSLCFEALSGFDCPQPVSLYHVSEAAFPGLLLLSSIRNPLSTPTTIEAHIEAPHRCPLHEGCARRVSTGSRPVKHTTP